MNLIKKLINKKQEFKEKHPYLYYGFLIFVLVVGLYWSNFVGNSSPIGKSNPFTLIFGQKSFLIREQYNIETGEFGSFLTLDLTNDGDKSLKNLTINYLACGEYVGEVELNKKEMYVGENQDFNINLPQKYDKNCSNKNPKTEVLVYENENDECFLWITESLREVCGNCEIEFEVYDGKKQIFAKEDSVIYSESNFKKEYDLKNLIELVLIKHPLTITWTQGYKSTCQIITDELELRDLNKKEPMYISIFNDYRDTCETYPDFEFCFD